MTTHSSGNQSRMPHPTQSRSTATMLTLLPILLGQTLPGRSAIAQEVGERFRDCPSCPEMVVIPAGTFIMGSPESEEERGDSEGPQHRVTIGTPFAVGVFQVTFADWDACVSEGACGGHRPEDEGWGRGSRPVINVSWEDAQEYVRWLSRETGEGYRLLTEAEWEYAARAGTTTARYWGESESDQCRHGNGVDAEARPEYPDRDASEFVACSDGYVRTALVGLFEPNPFGLYDMLGNVFEWTQDCWNDSYRGAPNDGSVWRAGDCSRRVVRGGSWYDRPRVLRSASRGALGVRGRLFAFGFRVARTMD